MPVVYESNTYEDIIPTIEEDERSEWDNEWEDDMGEEFDYSWYTDK